MDDADLQSPPRSADALLRRDPPQMTDKQLEQRQTFKDYTRQFEQKFNNKTRQFGENADISLCPIDKILQFRENADTISMT